MARETEVLLLGGGIQSVQADALEGFVNTPENGVEVVITSKRHAPFGPAADGVSRRIYVGIEHSNGIELDVIPLADGQRQTVMRLFLGRPPVAGDRQRVSFLVPTMKPAQGGAIALGMRATTFGVQIRSLMPTSEWLVQSLLVEAHPLQAARGRQEGE